nr:hypothetical protein [Shigella boydii]
MRKTTLLVLAAALCVPAFATAAPVLTAGFSPSDGPLLLKSCSAP